MYSIFDKSGRMPDMCPTAANGDMISGVELSQQSAAPCYPIPQFGTLPLAKLVYDANANIRAS